MRTNTINTAAVTAQRHQEFMTQRLALHAACRDDDIASARAVLELGYRSALIRAPVDAGDTPLIIASTWGSEAVVQLLLGAGADVNATNKFWAGALSYACMNGHLNIVRLLLKSDANVNAVQDHGVTPLIAASSRGHLAIVRLLLENGALVDKAEYSGWTALHTACNCGHLEVVRVLFDHGADVDAPFSNGSTMLIAACRTPRLDVVHVLLDCGADADRENNADETPLMSALMNTWGRFDTTLRALLLEGGADIDKADANGCTALLHACCRYGLYRLPTYLEAVYIFLKHHADPNKASRDGFTPLHEAAYYGSVELVHVLLAAGASLDQVNNRGETPLAMAKINSRPNVVQALLDAGASDEPDFT